MTDAELPIPLLSFDAILKMYPDTGMAELEHLVRVRKKRLYGWSRNGLTLHDAEHVASKIGLHPISIWGPEYHIAVYMMEIVEQIRYQRKIDKQKLKRKVFNDEKNEVEQASR
jgi:hypothetical protein